MRTTLTIDNDVAALLEKLRKARNAAQKDIVNEALRRGLREMDARARRRAVFRTRSVALGRVKIATIDNVTEALASAEGEGFA
jgi:predicted anti-sigma-YlaC factor YlaD